MTCYCGREIFANHRCWEHLQSGVKTMYRLGERLREIPPAFLQAFQNEKGETAMATALPSRTTAWLQNMANIQAKLKRRDLSPSDRQELKIKLRELERKLAQN